MSRSGYSDDCDLWELIKYRGQVASAIRGKRGQKFLRELLEALEAMPEKRLISYDLIHDGEVCALGCIGVKRGQADELAKINPQSDGHRRELAQLFDIAPQLVAEIEEINDGDPYWIDNVSPETRWRRVHSWVEQQIWDWTWE